MHDGKGHVCMAGFAVAISDVGNVVTLGGRLLDLQKSLGDIGVFGIPFNAVVFNHVLGFFKPIEFWFLARSEWPLCEGKSLSLAHTRPARDQCNLYR